MAYLFSRWYKSEGKVTHRTVFRDFATYQWERLHSALLFHRERLDNHKPGKSLYLLLDAEAEINRKDFRNIWIDNLRSEFRRFVGVETFIRDAYMEFRFEPWTQTGDLGPRCSLWMEQLNLDELYFPWEDATGQVSVYDSHIGNVGFFNNARQSPVSAIAFVSFVGMLFARLYSACQ